MEKSKLKYSKEYREAREINFGKLYDNPIKSLEYLKKISPKIKYYYDADKSYRTYADELYKKIQRTINVLKDIVPIYKKLKIGTTFTKSLSLVKKSKYWEYPSITTTSNSLKIRGPIDLYLIFKNGKLTKKYF